jgi:hypothetical protein
VIDYLILWAYFCVNLKRIAKTSTKYKAKNPSTQYIFKMIKYTIIELRTTEITDIITKTYQTLMSFNPA